MHYDVIVIGGGLVGMMSAYKLCQQDLKVAILERGSLGQEASIAGGGILSPLKPWAETPESLALYTLGQTLYPTLCQEIEELTGMETGYREPGLLMLDPDQGEEFQRWRDQANIQALDTPTVLSLLPDVSETIAAFLMPAVAQVENGKLIEALKNALLRLGVAIHEQCEVKALTTADRLVQSIDTDYGSMQAEQYILAAGAWSGDARFELGLEIQPVRGQMIAYQMPFDLCPHIILKDSRYCIPRTGHRLLVGSTVEEVGFDVSLTEEARNELVEFAESIYPVLRELEPVAQWSGLRPRPNRENPIIGPHPQLNNLILNTGHFRNGILGAPGSAECVAEIVLGQTSSLPREAFLPRV